MARGAARRRVRLEIFQKRWVFVAGSLMQFLLRISRWASERTAKQLALHQMPGVGFCFGLAAGDETTESQRHRGRTEREDDVRNRRWTQMNADRR